MSVQDVRTREGIIKSGSNESGSNEITEDQLINNTQPHNSHLNVVLHSFLVKAEVDSILDASKSAKNMEIFIFSADLLQWL
jgi:hypothetical protein